MVRDVPGIVIAVVLSLLVQFPATAQDRTNPRRVGWIAMVSEEVQRRADAVYGGSVISAAFAELDYHEGKDLIVEKRYAAGRFERGSELANELLQAGAEVLVTGGYDLSAAALQITQTIPVVGTVAESSNWLRASRGPEAISPGCRANRWTFPLSTFSCYPR